MDQVDQREEIERIKRHLNLEPHPGGCGQFREVWRGDREVTFTKPTQHGGSRASGTSIYSLLEQPNKISWHKHRSDEGYFWHAGGNVNVHTLHADGRHVVQVLGDVAKYPDCEGQIVIPHDTYFSTELQESAAYCLFSAVVMPGFEFEDWLVGKKVEMLKEFPQHEDIINKLASE